MTTRLIAILIALGVAACGVKNDLELPRGAIHQKGEPDASKPPKPLGQ